jgi:hypothetical protein
MAPAASLRGFSGWRVSAQPPDAKTHLRADHQANTKSRNFALPF